MSNVKSYMLKVIGYKLNVKEYPGSLRTKWSNLSWLFIKLWQSIYLAFWLFLGDCVPPSLYYGGQASLRFSQNLFSTYKIELLFNSIFFALLSSLFTFAFCLLPFALTLHDNSHNELIRKTGNFDYLCCLEIIIA